jgi:hypothetical protein
MICLTVRRGENENCTSPYLNGSDGFEEREILIFNELADIEGWNSASANHFDCKYMIISRVRERASAALVA